MSSLSLSIRLLSLSLRPVSLRPLSLCLPLRFPRGVSCAVSFSTRKSSTPPTKATPSPSSTLSAPSPPSPSSPSSSSRDLLLTMVGADRIGLVSEVSSALTSAKGNVKESRMTQLGEDFALLLRFSLSSAKISDQQAFIDEFKRQFSSFDVTIRPISIKKDTNDPLPTRMINIHCEGGDQPGLVSEMTSILAKHKASIIDFQTYVDQAPFSGEALFSIACACLLPHTGDLDHMTKQLREFADEKGCDIEVEEDADEGNEEHN